MSTEVLVGTITIPHDVIQTKNVGNRGYFNDAGNRVIEYFYYDLVETQEEFQSGVTGINWVDQEIMLGSVEVSSDLYKDQIRLVTYQSSNNTSEVLEVWSFPKGDDE